MFHPYPWWQERIEKATKGRLIIETKVALFPPTQVIHAVIEGRADCGWERIGWVGGTFPQLDVGSLPFYWGSGTLGVVEFNDALNDPRFRGLVDEMYDELGLVPVVHQPYPALETIFANRALPTVEDFAGLKLRTAGILPTLALSLMGAAPLTMGVTEIHEAMARGTVDGIQTGGFWGVAFGLCDIAKYCSVWPVQSQFYCAVMANKDSFDALPADLQEIVQDVNREMQGQAAYAIGIAEQNCLYIAIDMIGKTEVIRPEEAELNKVREICKPTIDKWLELAGPHGPEILAITSEYASGAEIMLK